MDFASRLLWWYDRNGRSLPWRGDSDPYRIWVSEVILQQTRVEQGVGYFSRFIEAFPDLHSLALAPLGEVLRLWQGLGYYTRARNLHRAARQIISEHNGQLPSDSQALSGLSGIGPYTSAAIGSIAFGERVPVIDGNVYRVLSRLFAIEHPIDTAGGKRAFYDLALSLMPESRPGDYNQALMDFGSLVCKPFGPVCHECLFNSQCLALQRNAVMRFPARKPKKKTRPRYFNYFLVHATTAGGLPGFFVGQRSGNDIWRGLYELPLFETGHEMHEAEVFARACRAVLPGHDHESVSGEMVRSLKHQLSHQTIHARLFRLSHGPGQLEMFGKKYILTDVRGFEAMAKPRLIERLLE